MSQHRADGFTLVELMVTIAIVAVLSAIAFPSFRDTLRSNQVATATNEVIAAVSLARNEAVRNNRGSSICASGNGQDCSGGWSAGWMVWSDFDGNGRVDAGETVMRYMQGRANLVLNGPATFVHFDSRGRRTTLNADSGSLSIRPLECNDQLLRRTLLISQTGQIRKDGGLEACQ